MTRPFETGAQAEPVTIEKDVTGKPHQGKVFVAIHAHLDDIPCYCGGTIAKLVREGYTGYIIRTTNDEKCGGRSPAENIKSNEEDHFRVAAALGISGVYDFYYRNHRMNDISSQELRSRFIFLYRFLKVDTVLTFNPWGHGEENPDHWVTGRAAEEACWMSGMPNDYPEHTEAGIVPHSVRERYYFVGRDNQPYNRVVDISSVIETKIDAIAECRSQGDGNAGSKLRARLAREGRRLPLLGSDDRTADREYIRRFLLNDCSELGRHHGCTYAEGFFYTDQRNAPGQSEVEKYVSANAVPLEKR
jgi:LmbE family N-acetylglucosaminyl deacetylase